MNNISFFKKYKPKTLKELNYKPQLIDFFYTLIQLNNLNCLIIGNSGSGKTTLIKVLINEYYKNINDYNINIMYINSLSEYGVNFYRTEVKTFCQTASSISGKKKFIVLDDIDLINDQSQQVFRNCIDKYSHNVHFLSSCSNIQKVIDSIQSRCTIVKIKHMGLNFLLKILNKIKKNEKLDITPQAEKFILNVCNNSTRVLINYMEKFKLLQLKITEKMAKEICTNISFYEFEKYTKAWFIDKNLPKAIIIIFTIFKKGYSVMDILDSYFIFVKTTTILDEESKYKLIMYICKYISIFHTIHESEIELALFTNEINKNI